MVGPWSGDSDRLARRSAMPIGAKELSCVFQDSFISHWFYNPDVLAPSNREFHPSALSPQYSFPVYLQYIPLYFQYFRILSFSIGFTAQTSYDTFRGGIPGVRPEPSESTVFHCIYSIPLYFQYFRISHGSVVQLAIQRFRC